jgi:hypothetical protein
MSTSTEKREESTVSEKKLNFTDKFLVIIFFKVENAQW